MKYKIFQNFVEGRKGEILDAALQVFGEKGYAGGSMRDIAALTGVSEPALYRHFAGKEELFRQLIINAGKKLTGEALQLVDNIKPDKIRESMESILKDRQKATKSLFPIFQTVLMESFRYPAFREVYREHLAMPIINKLSGVIQVIDAYYGHLYSPEESRQRLRIFISMFAGYFLTSVIFTENDSTMQADAIVRTMGWYGKSHNFREDIVLSELPADFNIIKKEDLKQKMQQKDFGENVTILDLRGPDAFNKDHIPGSIQVMIKELPDKFKKLLPDKEKEVIVVCSGGMQSLYAVMYLQMKGYQKVKSLGGGFSKWNKE